MCSNCSRRGGARPTARKAAWASAWRWCAAWCACTAARWKHALATRLLAMAAPRRPLMVALTGYGQPEDRVRSAQAGFDHHLVKPVDVGQLLALLEAPATR